ncbi:MAG: hypothetical protein LBT38_11165 [Deltaproteobacteria bacterium]|jgi:hypothetical protein|nr:hypothetical protein [Deltaproteobacteria bacterium]
MNVSVALILAFGVPLVFLSLGFFLLTLKLYRSREKETQAAEFLFLAQSLDRNFNELESRLSALEEYILGSEPQETTYSQ